MRRYENGNNKKKLREIRKQSKHCHYCITAKKNFGIYTRLRSIVRVSGTVSTPVDSYVVVAIRGLEKKLNAYSERHRSRWLNSRRMKIATHEVGINRVIMDFSSVNSLSPFPIRIQRRVERKPAARQQQTYRNLCFNTQHNIWRAVDRYLNFAKNFLIVAATVCISLLFSRS